MDFRIKKKDQGVNVRLGMGVLLALVGAALCYTCYGWFVDRPFFGMSLVGRDLTWGHVVSAAVGLVYVGACLWFLLFKEESVDFLIRVEREMQKVTWPTWEQLKNSVLVVVGVIVFFGIIVFAYDMVFMQIIWRGLLGLK